MAHLWLHPEAESQAIQNWRGGLWVRKEGVASKAVCQNGIDNTQAYGHLGHPAGISRRLPLRRTTGCDRDNSFRVWQTWWKRPSFAEGSLCRPAARENSVSGVWEDQGSRGDLYRSGASGAHCREGQREWHRANHAEQNLLEERLKCEEMDDPNNLVTCETCRMKTLAVKWTETTRPPQHLCLCLNRFSYNMQPRDFNKEKTPVKIDGLVDWQLRIWAVPYDTGWWFGTCFFQILGIIIPTDFHIFQRGWNHQPG